MKIKKREFQVGVKGKGTSDFSLIKGYDAASRRIRRRIKKKMIRVHTVCFCYII